jgi:hypothetical protein
MTNKKKSKIQEPTDPGMSEDEKSQKIQSLHEMISSAEKTIQSAKAMLLQFEGKKKLGRKRKVESEIDGSIVEGIFEGQIMIGNDGKQYPVPANYASKSKLVEGDMLKLTITPEGSFIYKQIGPAERKHAIGIASQDERGNYYIIADGKPYRVLLASITYFRVEPGDEVAITLPRDIDTAWCAIDNVIQKGKEKSFEFRNQNNDDFGSKNDDFDSEIEKWKQDVNVSSKPSSLIDEWSTNIDEIEKEVKKD